MDAIELDSMLESMEALLTPPAARTRRKHPDGPLSADALRQLRELREHHQSANDRPAHAAPGPRLAVISPASGPDVEETTEVRSTSVFSSNEPLEPPKPLNDTTETATDAAPPPAPHCAATTRSGNPCRAFARTGRSFCFAHDPDSRSEHLAAASAAGAASGEARRTLPAELGEICIIHKLGVMVALDALFRLEITGQLPPLAHPHARPHPLHRCP